MIPGASMALVVENDIMEFKYGLSLAFVNHNIEERVALQVQQIVVGSLFNSCLVHSLFKAVKGYKYTFPVQSQTCKSRT